MQLTNKIEKWLKKSLITMSACIAVFAVIISLNLQVNDTIVAQAAPGDITLEVYCDDGTKTADNSNDPCKNIQKGQNVWISIEVKNNTGFLIDVKTTHIFSSPDLEVVDSTYKLNGLLNELTKIDQPNGLVQNLRLNSQGVGKISYTLTATEEVDTDTSQSVSVEAEWGSGDSTDDSAFFSSVEGCDDTTPNSVDCSEPPPIGSKPPPDKLDSDGDGVVDQLDDAPNNPCNPLPVQDNGNLWPGSPWCPMAAIFDQEVEEGKTITVNMEVVPNDRINDHKGNIGGVEYDYFKDKFTVVLDTQPPKGPITEITPKIKEADEGIDYKSVSGKVINVDPNLPGDKKFLYPITITAIDEDDGNYEGDEYFMIGFSGITNLNTMIEARESEFIGAYGIIKIIDKEKPPEPTPTSTPPITQTAPTPDPISGTPKPNPQATLPENDQRAQNALDDIIYGTNCDSLGQTRDGAALDCQPDDSDCIRELNSGNIANIFWPGSNTPIIPKSCATATFINTDGMEQNIQAGLPVEFIPNVASRAYGFMASIAAYLFVVLFSIWGVQWMIGGLQYKSEDDLFNIKKNMRNSALALIITLTVSVLVIELLPVFGVSNDILGFKIRG